MSDAGKAVFLSYASQDAEAAKRICEALRAAGVEVWFDQNELVGGDAWDTKIRGQIGSCGLFLPVISASTQARLEGYFRIEWKLAARRTHAMAAARAFLLPVVIDDTSDAGAHVPDEFRDVQWTRLKGGETPPAFVARVKNLLGGETMEAGRPRPAEQRGEGTPPPSKPPRWLAPVIGSAAVAVIALAITQPWRASSPPSQSSNPPASAPAGQQTAAQKLVAQARALALHDQWDEATREDFAMAEELLKSAVELEQTNGEAWAAYSLCASGQLGLRYDITPAMRGEARRRAERAIKYAPDSNQARFAWALSYRLQETASREEVLRLHREAAEREPTNKLVLRQAGRAYESSVGTAGGAPAEDQAQALRYFDQAAALPGGDPTALRMKADSLFAAGRYRESNACIDQALALRPQAGHLYTTKIRNTLLIDLDLPGAQQALARMPAAYLLDDQGAYAAAWVHLWSRQPENCLAVLRGLTRDFLFARYFVGPKGALAGYAHDLAGRREAALEEWRNALAVTEQALKDTPGDPTWLRWKAELLARLGDTAKATTTLQLYEQMTRRPVGQVGYATLGIYLALGRDKDVLDGIEQLIARGPSTEWVASFRYEPAYDPLRNNPRFQELLRRAEAAVATAAKSSAGQKTENGGQKAAGAARDWPKDAELKKAFALINGADATPESCRLAEDLIEGVLKQKPTDAEASVVYAVLNNYLINRGYDLSEERYVLARRYAERAQQLAPDDPESLAAMAQFLTFRNADYARAEQLIRRAMTLAPEDPRFARILVYNVLFATRIDDALTEAKAAAARFPGDALTHYDLALVCRRTGDMALMEQALDRAVAIAPLGSAMIWKGWLAAWLHGDLPGFKSWLDRIGGNFRFSERAIYMRYVYACLSGDTASGLEAVRSFPGTWVRDFYYVGPRSLLLADLLALQGKNDLARTEYEKALAEIQRVAAQSPNDTMWDWAECWTLHGLGRKEEARQSAKRMFERLERPLRPAYLMWWNHPIPAQLLAGDRQDALALMREAAALAAVRLQMRTAMQIDPRMKPFRDDPEIKAILAEPTEKK